MRSSFALYQALRSINVTEDKATAVVDALESDMQTQLATKADLADIKADIAKLQASTKADFAQNELKLTIRMGVMISTAVGIMLTAMKFMH
ncbi:hypothetical protein [Pseudomonas oryzihabitans]|jgi:hypothetical protein|uniref:hypothetical protein n=1 Tax=Pseudomonas oryzihabitans TaxID=47885 RepID=UPI002894F52E|nr:hypothetical protein [Pseudomonas oryzihabitans]MDT3723125.1 hypothetical protein [Pseudomonas oryzihabitans]